MVNIVHPDADTSVPVDVAVTDSSPRTPHTHIQRERQTQTDREMIKQQASREQHRKKDK